MKKTKRVLPALLALALVIALAGCGDSSQTTSQPTSQTPDSTAAPVVTNGTYDLTGVQPTKLILSSSIPSTHALWTGFFEPWMEGVTAASDGLVTFDYYLAGDLVDYGKEYDALRDGIIDIAAPITPTYDLSRFPLSEVILLPLEYSDEYIACEAWDRMLKSDRIIADGKTFQQLLFGDIGIYSMGINITPSFIICTSGAEFFSLEAMKGLKIRASSRVFTAFCESLGFTPISITTYDLYDAMSRGAVDGTITTMSDLTTYGLTDLCSYIVTDFSMGHFPSTWSMTTDKFESLPPVVQQIFTDVADEIRPNAPGAWAEPEQTAISAAQEKGAKFEKYQDLPAEVLEAIDLACEEIWVQYIANMDEMNLPGREVAKLWMDCVVESGGAVTDTVESLLAG